MNRRFFLLLHMLGIALITGACGAADDTTEAATEYVSKGYSVETGTSGTQQTETGETFTFSNKSLGNLTEKSVNLIKNAVVYVKPDKNSAQLGSLEKRTKVKVVGKTEKDEWLMVNYNGRVAYIKADSIDEDDLSSVEETDEDTGSDSREDSSTTNSGNSNTNGVGTGGGTIKNPSSTNSGNTGNTGGTGSNSGNTGNGTITPTEPSNGTDDNNSGGNTGGTENPSQPSTEPDTPVTPTEPDNPVTPPTEPDNSPGDEEPLDGE